MSFKIPPNPHTNTNTNAWTSADLRPRFIKHIFFILLFLFAIRLCILGFPQSDHSACSGLSVCERSLRWERQNETNDGWKRELITLLINYLSCSFLSHFSRFAPLSVLRFFSSIFSLRQIVNFFKSFSSSSSLPPFVRENLTDPRATLLFTPIRQALWRNKKRTRWEISATRSSSSIFEIQNFLSIFTQ